MPDDAPPMVVTDPPPCMTFRQVAEHWGVAPTTVYGYICDELFGHLRLPGGSIRVRRQDVEAFEARRWVAPNSTAPATGCGENAPTDT